MPAPNDKQDKKQDVDITPLLMEFKKTLQIRIKAGMQTHEVQDLLVELSTELDLMAKEINA